METLNQNDVRPGAEMSYEDCCPANSEFHREPSPLSYDQYNHIVVGTCMVFGKL